MCLLENKHKRYKQFSISPFPTLIYFLNYLSLHVHIKSTGCMIDFYEHERVTHYMCVF